MNRKTIAIIYQADILGPKIGGIETFIKNFIKYSPEDFDIEFIGITSDSNNRPVGHWSEAKFGRKNFRFYPIFFEQQENKRKLIPLSLRFTIALAFSQLDFSNKILFFNRIEPAVIFNTKKYKRVAVIHSDIQKYIDKTTSEALWGRFPWLYRAFEKKIISLMDHVYTVSKNSLEYYESVYNKQKDIFSFLPMSVDPEIFYSSGLEKNVIKEKISAKHRIPVDKKWILFVGRLQEVKAPIRLIDTFMGYNKKNNNSALLVIGEGNLKEDMKKSAVRSGIEKSIHFLGNIDQKKLADFYHASDVMLLTSNSEGMPMCILEALACGLPVVSTDVGEMNLVVKNGISGEIVKSFSETDIVVAVEKVLNNPKIYSCEKCNDAIKNYRADNMMEQVYTKFNLLFD